MRSGVGAFCPRSLRLDFFEDFDRCPELPVLDDVDFFGVVEVVCAEAAQTPSPAATNSVRARCVAFRARIVSLVFGSVVAAALTAGCPPELCLTEKVSGSGRCLAGEGP